MAVPIPEIEITASKVAIPADKTVDQKIKVPVTSGLLTADDFYLEKINILTPKNVINIKSLFIELSYYEDIFRGTVSGHVLINDSISMIDRLGLSGNDYLELNFKKSKVADVQGISKYFRIYRVGERVLNNAETENYSLHFCSEELFLSEQTKVSKAYGGKTIEYMVTDILKNHMQIDEKYLITEQTEGQYDFVIPYKKPFDAINWLSSYAIPTKANSIKGADFVFFENSEGFNFRSLQSLFNSRTYQDYIYSQRRDSANAIGRDLFTIKSYTFLDTFDTLYGTVSGAFSNRLITIDPLTRRYIDTKFDYINDYQNKLNDKKKKSLINNTQNRLGKTANQNYDAVLKVMISNKDQKKAEGISDNPYTVANDIRAEKYVPYRTAQLALSHYVRLKLTIAGDPNLTVGTTINVYLPSSASNADGSGLNEGKIDEQYSGKYLITAVRHIISSKMSYETVLEVVRDGYGNSLADFKDTKKLADTVKGQR
jgi:hypothetical protein